MCLRSGSVAPPMDRWWCTCMARPAAGSRSTAWMTRRLDSASNWPLSIDRGMGAPSTTATRSPRSRTTSLRWPTRRARSGSTCSDNRRVARTPLGAAALAPGRVRSVGIVGGGTPLEEGDPAYEHLSEVEKEGVALIGVDDDRAAELMAIPDEQYSVAARDLDDDALVALWMSGLGPADRRLVVGNRSCSWVCCANRNGRVSRAGSATTWCAGPTGRSIRH